MLRFLAVSLVLFFVSFGSPCSASDLEDRYGLQAYLTKAKLLDDTLLPILMKSLPPLLSVLPWEDLKINAVYDEKSLHIYIVNGLFNDAAFPQSRFRDTALGVRDNFIAIPPNIILADRAALVKLLQSTIETFEVGRSAYLIYALTNRDDFHNFDPNGPVDMDALDRINISMNALRTRRLMTEFHRHLVNSSSVDIYARHLAEDFSASPERLAAAYTAALAPVILHESAHLMRRDTGGFLDWFKQYAQNLLNANQRAREDAADRQASLLFDQYSKKNDAVTAKALAAVGVRSYTSFLTARVWASVFDNFRGMNADQFFWDFFRHPCNRWDAWLTKLRDRWTSISVKIGADPADAGVLGKMVVHPNNETNLENPMLILNAENAEFPILSASEFKEIIAQRKKSLGNGSHAPHFIRASQLSGILESLTRAAMQSPLFDPPAVQSPDNLPKLYFSQELDLIGAITEVDPLRLAPRQALEDKESLGATVSSVQAAFADTYAFEPGVNCLPGKCFVGRLKSKRKGFIELINGQTGLSRIRVAARYGQQGDDQAFSGDKYEQRSKEIFPFLYMIGVLGDAAIDAGWITSDESVKTATEMVKSIKQQMLECKLPFLTFTLGKMVVWVEAKEDNWIFLSARPYS